VIRESITRLGVLVCIIEPKLYIFKYFFLLFCDQETQRVEKEVGKESETPRRVLQDIFGESREETSSEHLDELRKAILKQF
jgi:hypothetical protein